MSDLIRPDRPTAVQSRESDVAVWDATHLRVRELEPSLGFWRDLLGLRVLSASDETVALGTDDAELVVLHGGARRPYPRGHAGLYHLALHVPSGRDFAQMLVRLLVRGVDPRPTDHLMHWAMYLTDPDGIGLELSFETIDRFDHVIPGSRMRAMGSDGREHGVVEALDAGAILEAYPGLDPDAPMPAGTRVGHNHLHVSDLGEATRFYERLGFAGHPEMAGMVDFDARGDFAHRLAINEWQGHGAPPAPDDAAGLHHLALRHLRPELLPALADGGSEIRDPSGNLVVLTAPAR